MHKEQKTLLIHKKTWGEYCLLGLQTKKIAREAQPGQFIMVRTNQNSFPLLRRPISIHRAQDDILEIFFQQAGTGTTLLSKKERGEYLDIIGPLGKGFRLENTREKESVALIGGGRGIAPLYFLALTLRDRGVPLRIYYGGKTRGDIPLRHKLEEENFDTRLSTDDGSWGAKGFVTDLFEESIREFFPSRIFACGPEAMMAKIATIAREKDIYAEFSLESYMGCGFGACWGCVRKIRNGTKEEWTKVCEEGPVFEAEQIIWQEEEERL
jgi:dihydroorotate dehydrogenase electron transfer subunit